MRNSCREKRRTVKKKEEKTAPYLPLELIIQILLWLPVKSLLRFKCVCKSWFSLISDTHFANSHFQITAKHSRRVLFMLNHVPTTLSLDFEALHCDNAVSEIPNPIPNFVEPPCDSLDTNSSSCRGFIFLHNDPDLFIWNPSTRVYKQIPLSPNDSNSFHCLYGFGYDQLRDDYLVVSVTCQELMDYPCLRFFSLRDNTWKELEAAHSPYVLYASDNIVGSLFNGAIHWLVVRGDIKSLWAVDWANERVEIWVMNEYKVHSSWTKTLVLPIDGIYTLSFYPICSTKNGDIVGTDGDIKLLKYNDRGQLLEHGSFWDGPLPFGSQVTVYTESLLSLPGDNVQA
ncbi:F-box protein interaction domain protein [Medicago truncatula]|uniref:F-box protein interaction domain protein n=1 Tax=Medicago truncatula TaxID=3880 RepID=A0A072V1Z9_MEDTR|nr:F-box protein interaction domain protein [Medicago truncatula]